MKIIYGRAGSGKSEYIFKQIKNGSKGTELCDPFLKMSHKAPSPLTQKTYIVTPEQFTFTAEKRLLETLEEGATVNVEVLSFERMAYRVIKETVKDERLKIGRAEKAMLIYDVLSKHQKDLQFLGKSLENVDTVLAQITEFKKHNITVEALEKQVEVTRNEYIKAKLNDMLILYRDLEGRISANFIDENDLLTILAENIKDSHLFDGAVFYLDEFAGFTKQEYSVIRELNSIAQELYITVCTDDLRVISSPEADIFYDNKQNVQTLCEIGDIDKESQICVGQKNLPRFKNEELAHLEQNIFSVPCQKYEKEPENIKLYLAENPYNEVEYIASKILKLVRDEGYRFRDIAVICNNLSTYSSLCKAIFEEYDIPVFIDEKKDITQNVIIKYVMALLEIFSKSWSYDAVFNYIKTGLVPIENIYELENYCLKWGVQGKKFYQDKWSYEEKENFTKEQELLTKPLLDLKTKLDENKTAKNISQTLYDFLLENIGEENEIFETEENIEAWNLVLDTLEKTSELFGEQKMSFDGYSKILKTGLSAKELGQIPQTLDKVTVGDVNRSKTHKVRAVFIIGVNDGVFPSVHTSEGFFNDKDRAKLKEQDFELAKGTREKAYEENFNIYKAFSTAEEKLFISYSSSDSDGKALRKSLLISKLRRIFPKLVEEDSYEETVLTQKITFSKLLNNLENPEWREVLEWYNEHEPQRLESALRGLKYSNVPSKINSKNIEKLYGDNLKTSITQLERYESCPFSYYLQFGLRLSDKEKLDIKPIDTGTFMHDVIDKFFKELNKRGLNVREITEEEMKKIVDEIITEKTSHTGKFTITAKYRTLVQRLKRVVTSSIKYIVASLRESQFEVLQSEALFDTKPDSAYEPIEIKLDDGRRVSIRGKIDRIDIAKMPDGNYIRVIDYKSSTHDIDLNKVIAGLQLQLITYTDAVCENESVMPAGALYFTLLEPKIAERNLSKEEVEDLLKQNYRMNGMVLADVNIIKAMDTTLETGKSDKIPVFLKDDGNIRYDWSRVVTKEEFEKLQKYTKKLIKQISKEIYDGNISLTPFYSQREKRTACMMCSYKSICQFNSKFKNNNYRFIPNQKRQEILDKM